MAMLEAPVELHEPTEQIGEHGWVYRHPYASVVAIACFLFLSGIFVVQERVGLAPPPMIQTVGGDIRSILGPPGYVPQATEPIQGSGQSSIMSQTQAQAPYNYTAPPIVATGRPPAQNPAATVTTNSFDFDALLAQLIGPVGATGVESTSTGGADTQNLYTNIPQTMVSTSSQAGITRTQDQQSLYNYGNEIGATIQTFETTHGNESQVLKDQMEDRTNPLKNAAVVQIGKDLEDIGRTFDAMENIPEAVQTQHAALANSYKEIGHNLQLIPTAQSTVQLLDAIKVYNASADTFVKNYVAVAQVFSNFGVDFSSNEAGSVFTFTGGANF